MPRRPKIVEMQFTNLVGELRSIEVEYGRFRESVKYGKVVDGSSLHLARIEKSDLVLKPVMQTYFDLPWDSSETARVLCDIYAPAEKVEDFGNEQEYGLSPRYVLKKALAAGRKEGYNFFTSAEVEFFLLDQGRRVDEVGYFTPPPLDKGTALRREILKTLMSLGLQCEYAHHEVSCGQYEITLAYDGAIKMADKVMTFKYVAKNVADRKGFSITFMPKPFDGMNGSGMHMHMSLVRGEKNLFFGRERISTEAKYFIGGLLAHARALCAVAAPTVNSYKRLVAGYEAPVYICWGFMNRSTLIRVPSFNTKKSARVEIRMPDPKCNPYLMMAGMLIAGMDGVRQQTDPGEPDTRNVYENTEGLDRLPATLAEAVHELQRDTVLVEGLGQEIIDRYAELKTKEWEDYSKTHAEWNPLEITEWEKNRYLEAF